MSSKKRDHRSPKAPRKKGRSKRASFDREDIRAATKQAEMLLWRLIHIYETEGAEAAKKALLAWARRRLDS